MIHRPPSDREYDYGLDPGERFEPEDDPDTEPFDLARPHIMTVLGPIRPEEAGVTLPHEHLIATPPRYRHEAPDPDLILDDPHAALAELEDLYAAGGRTVVDATTAAYGRDIRALTWVAARAPVHIVAVTGHHKEAHAGRLLAGLSAEDVAARCVAEMIDGIDSTSARAGAIKAGISRERITALESVALHGAALAHLRTGAPVLVHCDRATMAHESLDILIAEGADPSRVILCHQDFRLDIPYLSGLLARGPWLSFDQVGKAKYASDADRAATIAALLNFGYGDRLLISGDRARRSSHRSYGGSPGLIHLVETFPLALMEAGLSAPDVRRLLVDNPSAALTIRRPPQASALPSRRDGNG